MLFFHVHTHTAGDVSVYRVILLCPGWMRQERLKVEMDEEG